MSSKSLERQAERAERLADRTVDSALKTTLLEAAKAYREQAMLEQTTLEQARLEPTRLEPTRLHEGDEPGESAQRPTWMGLGDGHEQQRGLTGF